MGTLKESACDPHGILSALSAEDGLGGWTVENTGYSPFPDIAFNAELDRFLSEGGDVAYAWSETDFRSDQAARDAVVESMKAKGKRVFDSAKARLASDPVPGREALLERTSYFEGLATNDAALKVLSGPGFFVNGPEAAFPSGRLPSLSGSRLSNHLGCSCLAFDRDGLLALTLTTAASAVYASKVSPSGAGSCDVEDFDGIGGIARAAAKAMERETREELGLGEGSRLSVEVIGFRRMLDRGGKPDFTGVARLEGSFVTSIGKVSEDETGYTDHVMFLDVRSMGKDGLHLWALANSPRLANSLKAALHAFLASGHTA